MVTHIIHIADLHIRTGDPDRARIQEYQYVFQRFLEDVERRVNADATHEYITVIAGDIFHNKGRIESAGVRLFSQFLHKLSALTRVFFICGNHDFRQEDPSIPDMLESMLDPWGNTDKIQYLKDTGLYEYKNVGFGVVSVKDTLRKGNTSGVNNVLPAYPSPSDFGADVKHKIALYHGNSFPFEWFKGYDMALMGDIHKQQTGTTEYGLRWGYPGSLIQQDHGESIYGHGYLLWDLVNDTVTAHHVGNKYGLVTMRCREQEYEVYTGSREWKPLHEACAIDSFPQEPVVRLFGGSSQELHGLLNQLGVTPRHMTKMSRVDEPDVESVADNHTNEIEELSKLSSPSTWKEYIQGVAPHLSIESWLEAPDTMNIPRPSAELELPTNVADKIGDRITKFTKHLHDYADTMGSTSSTTKNIVCIKNVKWDYTLCYGEDNYFDFDNMKSSIALLNGKNASGKSSFLDMLCLGLFGEQTKPRISSGKKMTAKIIHNKKPANKKAMNVCVLFTVNGETYEVIREFGVQADKTNMNQFGVELWQISVEEGNKTLVKEGTSAVNGWIEKHIGTLDSVLLSNFITQLDSNNFFVLKQDDQKQLMEKALHLESVTAFGNLVHEARLAHGYAISQASAVLDTTKRLHSVEAVRAPKELEQHILQTEQELHELQQTKEACLRIIDRDDASRITATSVQECEDKIEDATQTLSRMGDLLENTQNTVFQELGTKLQILETLRKNLKELDDFDATLLWGDEYDIETIESSIEEKKQEIREHDSNRPVIPKYTAEGIADIRQEYIKWKARYDAELFTAPIESLEQTIELLQSIHKPTHYTVPKETLQNLDEFEKARTQSEQHEENLLQYQYQGKNDEEYKLWTKKYNKWLDKHQAVRETSPKVLAKQLKKLRDAKKNQELVATLNELNKELAEFADLPYNGDCWACKQQPWRAHFNEKHKRAESLREQLSALTAKSSAHQVTDDQIIQAEELVRLRAEYDDQLPQWTQEYEQWTKWRSDYKAYKQNLQAMNEISCRLWEFKHRHAHLSEFVSEWKMWECQLRRIEEAQEQTSVYAKWEATWNQLCHELHNMEQCQRKVELQEQVEKLEEKYHINQKKLERFKKFEEVQQSKLFWERERAKLIYQTVSKEVQSKEQSLKELRMEYGHAQMAYEKYIAIERVLNAQADYLQLLKSRESQLVELEKWFVGDSEEEGYKRWIYVTKVIPLLQRELNRCLRYVDTIRMKIEYDKGNFIYTVEDGDRKPSLDKASGYQSFIISLCMRITLGRIGASRNMIRQLIIDEGFTSCDVDNLSKMPTFIDMLLRNGDYDSVLLMSHLEGIRENTTLRIDIMQKGPFSQIQWGNQYPTFAVRTGETTKPVKRGRPKKTST